LRHFFFYLNKQAYRFTERKKEDDELFEAIGI